MRTDYSGDQSKEKNKVQRRTGYRGDLLNL